MTKLGRAKVKLAVAVVLDVADLTIGAIFGFGTVFDAFLVVCAFIMFGWKGALQAIEVATPDQIDAFVPTLTLLALAELRVARKEEQAAEEPDPIVVEGA